MHTGPALDPSAWADAARAGADAVPIINLPGPPSTQADLRRWPGAPGRGRGVAAGPRQPRRTPPARSTDVIAEIMAWARYPVTGVSSIMRRRARTRSVRWSAAVRTARAPRPGARSCSTPACRSTPAYRRLDATVCTFEGSWTDYRDLVRRDRRRRRRPPRLRRAGRGVPAARGRSGAPGRPGTGERAGHGLSRSAPTATTGARCTVDGHAAAGRQTDSWT